MANIFLVATISLNASIRKVFNTMVDYKQIQELVKNSGKSMNQIERELGYARNTIASYKKQNPSTKRLGELAKYFNVSVDYLLGNTSSKKLDLAKLDDDIVASNLSYSGKELSDNDRQALNAILKDYFENNED